MLDANDKERNDQPEASPLPPVAEENTGFAIVVNGHSLVHCLTPELEDKFLKIASQCESRFTSSLL
jgi:phospholipid-translocating ATPase